MNPAPTIALSTCWNSHRHPEGQDVLEEAASLGFSHVELGHGTRIVLVEGIRKAVKAGVVKVASVHNFCPLPAHISHAAPNLYKPTAKDPAERQLWFRNTIRTLDFAAELGAGRCILHGGSAEFFWFDPGEALERASKGKPLDSLPAIPAYQKRLARSMARLVNNAQPWMDRLRESLESVIPAAKARGIKLCLENREGFTELPMDQDIAGFIASLSEPDTIGYWHDAGHAQLKQLCGIFPHRELLERNRGRHFGFHLHDTTAEGRDHQEVGTGTIDWNMVREFMRPDHLFVLELSPRLDPGQVVRSRLFIERLLQTPAP